MSARKLYPALIRGFCALAEFRDPDTGAHLDRLAAYVRVLGSQLQADSPYAHDCDADFVRLLCGAVPLHDIGKVGIPDRILLKPGPLTPAERAIMQTHTNIGERLLESVLRLVPASEAPLLRMAADIAAAHHERWDGRGYPRGLIGQGIPLAARIASVADVYDACSTPRVYRSEAMSADAVRDMILAGSGSQFDPIIVAAFRAVEPRFRRLRQAMADAPAPLPAPPAELAAAQPPRILIVDDEPAVRRVLRAAVESIGGQCDEAERVTEARQRLQEQHYDLVTLDIFMPGEFGTQLLSELAPRAPDVAVVMVSGDGDIETGVQAMRLGAYDYLLKPLHLGHVRMAVSRALERQRLEQEAIAYRARLEQMAAARVAERPARRMD